MPKWPVRFTLSLDASAPEVVGLLARVHALSAVIRGIPIPPPVQERLDRLNIIRAVHGTTGVEGNTLSEEEVKRVLENPRAPGLPPGREREQQEVINAESTMRYIVRLLVRHPDHPLDEAVVHAIHSHITSHIAYD